MIQLFRKPALLALFAFFLGALYAQADQVMVADSFIVDRSTIEMTRGQVNGKLTITFSFGSGKNNKAFTVLYANAANSPEAVLGFRKLLDLVRNPSIIEFGDPQLGPMCGLKIERLLSNQEK